MIKPTVARAILSATAALVGGALIAAAWPLAIGVLWTAVKYARLGWTEVALAMLFALGVLWLGWAMHLRAVRTARAWTSGYAPAKLSRFIVWFVVLLAIWPVGLTVLIALTPESAHGLGPAVSLIILGTPLMALGGGLLGLANWMLRRTGNGPRAKSELDDL